MHEGHFTEQIVEAIIKEVGKYPAARVQRVKVSVGEMYHLEPESVKEHFLAMTAGTALGGAVLELDEIPVKINCRTCGLDGPVEDHHLMMCAGCGSTDVGVMAGDVVEIEEIDLEDGDDS